MEKANKPTVFVKQLLFILFLGLSGITNAQTYWQQRADHLINVSLDPASNALNGFSKITYTNNSPDTLNFLWFHLWPNAYKNDRTAFSEQLLGNGDTRFYFADRSQRGYINRLDFRVSEKALRVEEHPEHIDILKVYLPSPLPPKERITLTTPFHVQLPFNFSRGGWNASTYQITQWYPKPAVYDAKGWHLLPYLDQGEFYSDFGDYTVKITVPEPFAVAATGEPQQPLENVIHYPIPQKKVAPGSKKPVALPRNWSSVPTKTLIYQQEHVHDFAWFADTSWTLQRDTVRLPSGKIVNLQVYFNLQKIDLWQNSLVNLKEAITYLSRWLGDYPYQYATVVDGEQGFTGGMEYPSITILTGTDTPKELDLTIFHEIGHNWFYGALASNERLSPWMDEGMNSFYERRYERLKYPHTPSKGISGLLNDPRFNDLLLLQQIQTRKDQPISTPADKLTAANYGMIAYTKAARWMEALERIMGHERFDKAMKRYFAEWKHKHPSRSDFQAIMEATYGKDLGHHFSLLDKKGLLSPASSKPVAVLPFYRVDRIFDKQPVFLMPLVSYNSFNGIMGGMIIHNYTLPVPKFNFAMLPFYGLSSKKLNGWSRFAYTWHPDDLLQSIELSTVASRFNQREYTDTAGNTFSLAFSKFAPSLKMVFKEQDARSTMNRFLQVQYIRMTEDELRYDENTSTLAKKSSGFGILQSRFILENTRTLYPWKAELRAESHNDFYRLNFTGKYFFNFLQKGGVQVRLFAGKFMYKGNPGLVERFRMQRYHLQLSGPKGFEDYSYSTPFLGRFDYDGFTNQQIMERDGYFKVRTDLLSYEVGRSDNWLSSLNLEMDIPDRFNLLHVLPVKIPLRLFFDIGTYGDVWRKNADQPRFLFDGGIHIPLLKNTLNFYFPLIYSKVYRDYFMSVPGNAFLQRMSFSINIQELNLKKLTSSFQ